MHWLFSAGQGEEEEDIFGAADQKSLRQILGGGAPLEMKDFTFPRGGSKVLTRVYE